MPKQPSRIVKPKASSKSKGTTKKKTTRAGRSGGRRTHQQYGTSKLETYFATEFLDKLGLDYIYEYEAREIKRFYDFAIVKLVPKTERYLVENNGITGLDQVKCYYRIIALCEIDGGWFHSDPRLVDENKMNYMQRHNKFVDELKDAWCMRNNIPLLRFWEEDIRKNPDKVMNSLKSFMDAFLSEQERKRKISDPRART